MKAKRQILAAKISKKRSQQNELALEKEVTDFFKELAEQVQTNLEEYWSEYQLLQGHVDLITAPIMESHEQYYKILEKYNKREYRLGQEEAERLVQLATDKEALKARNWGVRWKSNITKMTTTIRKKSDELFGTIRWTEEDLLERVFTASKRTLARVSADINQLITKGYTDGMGINVVANTLTKRFNELETWEAKRIARTEIHNSHNRGVMKIYEEMNVGYTQWIAADDDRTRDSHAEINGEIIPMGGQYSNGLSYPGDTSGPIEEWINCRCSNAPFVMPYGYTAPPGMEQFRESDLVPMQVMEKPQMIEDVYEPPSDDFVKQINYIREGNWSDPNAMMDRIDRLGDRKTNKLTNEEIESLQYEAQYYVEQDRIRYEELQFKLEEMEERLEEEYYPKGSYLYDKLKKDIKKTRKEVKKLSQYY